jgi:hypothetical protein
MSSALQGVGNAKRFLLNCQFSFNAGIIPHDLSDFLLVQWIADDDNV